MRILPGLLLLLPALLCGCAPGFQKGWSTYKPSVLSDKESLDWYAMVEARKRQILTDSFGTHYFDVAATPPPGTFRVLHLRGDAAELVGTQLRTTTGLLEPVCHLTVDPQGIPQIAVSVAETRVLHKALSERLSLAPLDVTLQYGERMQAYLRHLAVTALRERTAALDRIEREGSGVLGMIGDMTREDGGLRASIDARFQFYSPAWRSYFGEFAATHHVGYLLSPCLNENTVLSNYQQNEFEYVAASRRIKEKLDRMNRSDPFYLVTLKELVGSDLGWAGLRKFLAGTVVVSNNMRASIQFMPVDVMREMQTAGSGFLTTPHLKVEASDPRRYFVESDPAFLTLNQYTAETVQDSLNVLPSTLKARRAEADALWQRVRTKQRPLDGTRRAALWTAIADHLGSFTAQAGWSTGIRSAPLQ